MDATPLPLTGNSSPDLERKVLTDTDCVSSNTTLVDKLRRKHSTFPFYDIIILASSIPLLSAVILLLMLIGHLLVLGLSPQTNAIHTVPIAASVASGAVGGAVWAGASLTFLCLFRLVLGPDNEDILRYVAGVLSGASIFGAPPIGVHLMYPVFHGHVLGQVMAIGITALTTAVLGFTTLVVLFVFVCATGIGC